MLRRFFLIGIVLVAGVVMAPTSSAVILGRTLGSAEVELRAGAGVAKIRFRGTFIGYVARGRIVATNNVTVTGWESRRRISSTLIAYRGAELRFKVYNQCWGIRAWLHDAQRLRRRTSRLVSHPVSRLQAVAAPGHDV
jgi:hypothetical protein